MNREEFLKAAEVEWRRLIDTQGHVLCEQIAEWFLDNIPDREESTWDKIVAGVRELINQTNVHHAIKFSLPGHGFVSLLKRTGSTEYREGICTEDEYYFLSAIEAMLKPPEVTADEALDAVDTVPQLSRGGTDFSDEVLLIRRYIQQQKAKAEAKD